MGTVTHVPGGSATVGTGRAAAEATFIGTATCLLRLGGFTFLTDPNFLHAGQRAYLGYGLWSRRRTDPAMRVNHLPRLDGVLLSHLHGDHFDRVARRGLSAHLPIVTTPHAERRLRRWGFIAANGLRTWETYERRRRDEVLRVTAVPAQHGPALVHRLMPPTMGSVVDWERVGGSRLRLYITGDTVRRPWLAEIAERFPGIDATLVHLGGTRVFGVLLTMDAGQGADLMTTVPSAVTVPIHYDDYGVFRSGLSEFLAETRRRGLAGKVRVVRRGETVSFAGRR